MQMRIKTRWSGQRVEGGHYLLASVPTNSDREVWVPVALWARSPKRLTRHEKNRVLQNLSARLKLLRKLEYDPFEGAEVLQPTTDQL